MDVISGGIAAAATAKLSPPIGRLLERAAGPAADELGEWMRDKVRAFRRRNTEVVTARAEAYLQSVGEEGREVPFATLLPLLEGASLQDNPEMQEYWAALLANAAAGRALSPMFTRILEALSPVDARVLQACSEVDKLARDTSSGKESANAYVTTRKQIAERTSMESPVEIEITLDILSALRLVESVPALYPLEPGDQADEELGVRVTSLGRAFVSAVTPPA